MQLNAQSQKWPIAHYGGEGSAYGSSRVIDGYFLLNSKQLTHVVNKSARDGTYLDTLIVSDTLKGRIKLYVLGKHMDIQVSKNKVLSIPCTYISSIVGVSSNTSNTSFTRWVILSPEKFIPLGRVIAQKDSIIIYDSSKKDTVGHNYKKPITLDNGIERIEIDYLLSTPKKSLLKFIRKRYSKDLKSNGDNNFTTERNLLDYILEQEKIFIDRRRQLAEASLRCSRQWGM